MIRKSRTSDNHRWTSPIPDVRRATRCVSAAEAARKSGSPPSLSEECLFSFASNVVGDGSAAISRTQDFPMTLQG